MKKIYCGFISDGEYGEDYSTILISDNKEPIAKRINDDLEEFGGFATVKYYLSSEKKTIEELKENELKKIVGSIEAEYDDAYSEYTGYLWTDENLKIEGHNLLVELENNIGKYIYLEIEYNKKTKEKL